MLFYMKWLFCDDKLVQMDVYLHVITWYRRRA